MKREFDVELNYKQYRIIEKLLEAELEDYIFEEDFFVLEHAVDLLVAYRKLRDAADDALDEMMSSKSHEECTNEENECVEACDYSDCSDGGCSCRNNEYEKVFNKAFPVGSIVMFDYDVREFLPGEWIVFEGNEGFWLRIN